MAKKQHPFLPMFVGDFFAATAEWEGEEEGLYALLLMRQWTLGHLPAELPKLARLVKFEQRNFERWWPAIASKFEIHKVDGYGDRLVNVRLEQHRNRVLEVLEKKAAAGKKGAQSKWQKDGIRQAGAVASVTAIGGTRQKSAMASMLSIQSNPILSNPEVLPPSPPAPGVGTPSSEPGTTHTPDARSTWLECREAYPNGLWEGPKEILAERAIGRLLEEGEPAATLVAAAGSYRAQQEALGKLGTEFIRGPEKFYGEGHWRGPFKLPKPSAPKATAPTMDEMRAKYGVEASDG